MENESNLITKKGHKPSSDMEWTDGRCKFILNRKLKI